MNTPNQTRFLSTALFWIGVLVSGIVGRSLGPDFAVRIAHLASSLFRCWVLSLLLVQLLTAMICFLLLYRVVALGMLAGVAAKRGFVIETQSTFRGMLLSAFIPLLVWAVGMALMLDSASSGMHDSI
jgi:hypothetical protein